MVLLAAGGGPVSPADRRFEVVLGYRVKRLRPVVSVDRVWS
jgi:hypothetical protein